MAQPALGREVETNGDSTHPLPSPQGCGVQAWMDRLGTPVSEVQVHPTRLCSDQPQQEPAAPWSLLRCNSSQYVQPGGSSPYYSNVPNCTAHSYLLRKSQSNGNGPFSSCALEKLSGEENDLE